ncbi:MAG: hypothetical protein D6796_06980 [Caldilineae bacterium]|nr:MAG: hypothetical protein D6796_06980 [Caldilineae bacterium]
MKLSDFFKKQTDSTRRTPESQIGKEHSKAQKNVKNLSRLMAQQAGAERNAQGEKGEILSPNGDAKDYDQALADLESRVNALREQKMAEERAAMAALQARQATEESKISPDTNLEPPQPLGDDITNVRSGGIEKPDTSPNPETLERSRSPEG